MNNSYKNNKTLTAEENGRKFTLNITNYIKYKSKKDKIDGDIISKNLPIERCDYAITILNNENEKYKIYYIELKGRNLDKAIEQLKSTINYLKEDKIFGGFKYKAAYIILSAFDKFHRSKISSKQQTFSNNTGFVLAVRTNQMQETLN